MNYLERKFGKYAIPNLSLVLLICYAVGYVIQLIDKTGIVLNYMSLNPYAIFMRGQVWRLVTWIMIPPINERSSGSFFLIVISLIFYYSIGKTLERTWGDWMYNLYIFSGMFMTFVAVTLIFVYYLVIGGIGNLDIIENNLQIISRYYVSTYYINMSIFLAFATTFPDAQVLLMFIIPVKIKYLGIAYGALLVYDALAGDGYSRVIIVASLVNFIVFFFMQRRRLKGKLPTRVKQVVRRREFKQDLKASSITKHKCAICGRTEKDGADLEFRFCSKCNGNYEYCKDHLFTHKHFE